MFLSRSKRFNATARRLRQNVLVCNTVAMLAGSGTRLLIQGIYFVLIARALGAEQYGAFVAVVALVAILAPFSPLGTGQVLVRNVARDRGTFRYSWGNALWMTTISGSVLLAVVALLARYVLARKVPLALVLLVGCSDLLMSAGVGLAALAFQAVEQLHRTAQIYIVLTSLRAISALILVLVVSHPTAFSWGIFYFFSSVAGMLYASLLVCSKLGWPRLLLSSLRSDLLEGFYFAISLSSASLYNDIDKTMLVRLATFSAAGIYAAAYRLMDFAFQPVNALLAATYPRFFQDGIHGLPGTKRLAKRMLPFAIGYALLAATVLILLAPVTPFILGHDFGECVRALRWLSPLVVFRAIHYFLANTLTGAGFQGLRSGIQIFVAGFNVVLNLWLIPLYSWRGAAWASLASDGMLAMGMLAAVAILGRGRATSKASCRAESRVIS